MASTPSERPQKPCRVTPHSVVVNDDNFSALPDEIISCHILPKLNVREAASTTILSHRWRNLWSIDNGIYPSLVFRYSPEWVQRMRKFYGSEYMPKARSIITHAINRILKTHYTNPTLDELTICFNFDVRSFRDIDTWLELAFGKGTKRLELDFSNPSYVEYRNLYVFPSIQKLSSLHMQAGIINLRELYLKYVQVTSKVVQYLVSNCPSLERLSVSRTRLIGNINICEQSTKLKSLELDVCHSSTVRISASNLVSLTFRDSSITCRNSLFIKHAPKLSELSLGKLYSMYFLEREIRSVRDIPYLCQLKTLKLDVPYLSPLSNIKCPVPCSKFTKLEELEVKMKVTEDTNFYSWLIVLIEAAPLMQRLSVDPTFIPAIKFAGNPPVKVESEVEKAIKQMNRHQSLKLIELRGDGHEYKSCLMELCMHLMHISDALEEFVIIEHPNDCLGPQDMERLIKSLPPGVDLVHL